MDNLQSLLSQVSHWHGENQYEPIVQMLEMLIESPNGFMKQLQPPSAKVASIQQIKATLFTYFGDSLYRLKYFKRAQRAYEQALAFNETGLRRPSKRFKSANTSTTSCDISKIISNSDSINTNENELKYRIHLCLKHLNELKEAQVILEKIPPVERCVKVLTSLADLYWEEKNMELARKTYLEILRRDPLRLDIVRKLCKLGGIEASSIMACLPDDMSRTCSWYPSWIQAQCHLHSSNSKQAIRMFENLTSRFERTAPILTNLAQAHYHDGNFKEAIRIYQVAYSCDPDNLSGMDYYAACLHKEMCKKQLEDLAVSMLAKCNVEGEYFHEPWLVLAHYHATKDRKEPSALLFTQKAYKINRSSTEALILLAYLSLDKKDSLKAQAYIMSAQNLAPYRFEVQRILCDCFLQQGKKIVALNFAKAATKLLGDHARAYHLCADVMLKIQDQRRRSPAKSCLERACKLDKDYLPAVIDLTEILIEDKKFERAIEILTLALPNHSSNRVLHGYLATCYKEIKDDDKALHHQALATEDNVVSFSRINDDHLHRVPQESQSSFQDEADAILGLEADEYSENWDQLS